MAATMVGVFLLFSHIKNAQCTDSYIKKGGQIKMTISTFFPARSKAFLAVVNFICVLAIYRQIAEILIPPLFFPFSCLIFEWIFCSILGAHWIFSHPKL
jgi:hypothetical protein